MLFAHVVDDFFDNLHKSMASARTPGTTTEIPLPKKGSIGMLSLKTLDFCKAKSFYV